MSLLRGLLFENLGLKFVALLLSVLIYLNARTDRPVTLAVSFPVSLRDLPDSISIAGPVPAEVHAEIRGTGKQVIRLRLTKPTITISLAGVGVGHFERSLSAADLPLTPGLEVERMIGPRMLVLELDHRARRRVPVAARLEWAQPAAAREPGRIVLDPTTVTVSGPARSIAKLDSVALVPVRVDGRRDTVRAEVGPDGLPQGCTVEPQTVRVTVVLGRPGP
jgi:YbbR domain-containing protein